MSDESRAQFAHAIRNGAGDVLLVTGDTSIAPTLVADLAFLADAAARPGYFVLGTHDHFRGSVGTVRDAAIALSERRSDMKWLPPAGVIRLADVTALVGVDGWADGRLGQPLTTPLVLNDDRLIGELAMQATRAGKLAVRQALADADAARLAVLLERAIPGAKRIVVATHVPPFAEALPRTGRLSSPHWLPLLVSHAIGVTLKRIAANHRHVEFTVLCGHTHVATDVMVAPNLRCVVAGARYGEPMVRTIHAPSLK